MVYYNITLRLGVANVPNWEHPKITALKSLFSVKPVCICIEKYEGMLEVKKK